MRIAYLVHNLADPAVGKRLRMLKSFADDAVAIGFRRDQRPHDQVEGVRAVDLGRTFDANLVQRIGMVVKRGLRLDAWAASLRDCDVLVARNLEMLVLAALARRAYAPHAALVYESLDIHRLLLSERLAAKCMRALERFLLRKTDLLIVSSPAFLREYFEPRYDTAARGPQTLIIENKLFPAPAETASSDGRPGPPWRVGWFGMIRCRKSLDYLADLSMRHPGLLEVMIRGRPSRTELTDFEGQIGRTPGMAYGGPYRSEDLGAHYGAVHFAWAIDFFEEGANSRWLLPNRIYEGGAFGCVPIALADTETGRWLKHLGIGVCLEDMAAFEPFLLQLTSERYAELKRASCAVPKAAFVAGESDCLLLRDFVRRAIARRRTQRSCAALRELDLLQTDAPGDARPRDSRP